MDRVQASARSLSSRLGVTDLLMAFGILLFPHFVGWMGVSVSGCRGLGLLFYAWGSAAAVAVSGLLFLVGARPGSWGGMVIGVAAPIVGVWLVLDSHRYQPATVLTPAWLLVPACLQLPMALAVRRRLRGPA